MTQQLPLSESLKVVISLAKRGIKTMPDDVDSALALGYWKTIADVEGWLKVELEKAQKESDAEPKKVDPEKMAEPEPKKAAVAEAEKEI